MDWNVDPWMEAAEQLLEEEWVRAVSGTAETFWTEIKDKMVRLLRGQGGQPTGPFNMGPPRRLIANTDSQVFVPLLLDATGLLTPHASRA